MGVLTPEMLGQLLELLHKNGYRLRAVNADGIEVAERLNEPAEPKRGQPEVDEAEEYERDKWAHVGGKPPFIKSPKATSTESPWIDKEGPPS